MEVTVPNGLADKKKSVITITTKSDLENTKTATGIYTSAVHAAAIGTLKTHTPAGTPSYLIPGDIITYTITPTNSGSSAGTAMTFTDPVPMNLTYVAGSLQVNVNGAGKLIKDLWRNMVL